MPPKSGFLGKSTTKSDGPLKSQHQLKSHCERSIALIEHLEKTLGKELTPANQGVPIRHAVVGGLRGSELPLGRLSRFWWS